MYNNPQLPLKGEINIMKLLRVVYQLSIAFLQSFVPPEIARNPETNPMRGFNTSDADEFLGRTVFRDPTPAKGTHSLGPR